MPFSDARGDTFETSLTKDATLAVIEILSVSGQRVGQTYILTLTFNQPVLPLSAGAPNSLSGRIDVDTGAGGVESGASAFNPFRQPVGVGVTATIDLGAATMTIAGPPPQTSPVEMHFVDNVVTVAIPLSLLDITKSRIVVVVGNRLEATDVAPNERSIGTKDDPIDQPTVSFAGTKATGLESVGAVGIQVKLSKPSRSVVTVAYSASGGTATEQKSSGTPLNEDRRKFLNSAAMVGLAGAGLSAGLISCKGGEAPEGKGGGMGGGTEAAGEFGKYEVPPGKLDDYYMFSSGGHSGDVRIYGLPSGRTLKQIPVFNMDLHGWLGYHQ